MLIALRGRMAASRAVKNVQLHENNDGRMHFVLGLKLNNVKPHWTRNQQQQHNNQRAVWWWWGATQYDIHGDNTDFCETPDGIQFEDRTPSLRVRHRSLLSKAIETEREVGGGGEVLGIRSPAHGAIKVRCGTLDDERGNKIYM